MTSRRLMRVTARSMRTDAKAKGLRITIWQTHCWAKTVIKLRPPTRLRASPSPLTKTNQRHEKRKNPESRTPPVAVGYLWPRRLGLLLPAAGLGYCRQHKHSKFRLHSKQRSHRRE